MTIQSHITEFFQSMAQLPVSGAVGREVKGLSADMITKRSLRFSKQASHQVLVWWNASNTIKRSQHRVQAYAYDSISEQKRSFGSASELLLKARL